MLTRKFSPWAVTASCRLFPRLPITWWRMFQNAKRLDLQDKLGRQLRACGTWKVGGFLSEEGMMLVCLMPCQVTLCSNDVPWLFWKVRGTKTKFDVGKYYTPPESFDCRLTFTICWLSAGVTKSPRTSLTTCLRLVAWDIAECSTWYASPAVKRVQ